MMSLNIECILLAYCLIYCLIINAIVNIMTFKDILNEDMYEDKKTAIVRIGASLTIKFIAVGLLKFVIAYIIIILIKWILGMFGVELANDLIYVAIYIVIDIIKKFLF